MINIKITWRDKYTYILIYRLKSPKLELDFRENTNFPVSFGDTRSDALLEKEYSSREKIPNYYTISPTHFAALTRTLCEACTCIPIWNFTLINGLIERARPEIDAPVSHGVH